MLSHSITLQIRIFIRGFRVKFRYVLCVLYLHTSTTYLLSITSAHHRSFFNSFIHFNLLFIDHHPPYTTSTKKFLLKLVRHLSTRMPTFILSIKCDLENINLLTPLESNHWKFDVESSSGEIKEGIFWNYYVLSYCLGTSSSNDPSFEKASQSQLSMR